MVYRLGFFPPPRILFSKNIIKNVINWLILWNVCSCLQKNCHTSCHLQLCWSREWCSCLQQCINFTMYFVLVQVTYKILTEFNVAANNIYSKWVGFITGCNVAHIQNIYGEWYIHMHMETKWKYILFKKWWIVLAFIILILVRRRREIKHIHAKGGWLGWRLWSSTVTEEQLGEETALVYPWQETGGPSGVRHPLWLVGHKLIPWSPKMLPRSINYPSR